MTSTDKAVEKAKREARVFCWRNKSLDTDEVTGEALVIAAEVLNKFDGRGDIAGWVGSCVAVRLVALNRSRLWRARVARGTQPEVIDKVSKPAFDAEAFISELSTDAAKVVRLALRLGTKYATVAALKKAGWHACSIEAVFAEIRASLV